MSDTLEYPRTSLQIFAVRLNEKGAGSVVAGRVTRAGDVIHLPPWNAQLLVRQGEAQYCCLVRVLRDGLTVGDRVCAVGEVVSCAPDVAQRYREARLVEIEDFGPDQS